jgi:hypothetical protein
MSLTRPTSLARTETVPAARRAPSVVTRSWRWSVRVGAQFGLRVHAGHRVRLIDYALTVFLVFLVQSRATAAER